MYSARLPNASTETNCIRCSTFFSMHMCLVMLKYFSFSFLSAGHMFDVMFRWRSSLGLSIMYWNTLYVFLSIMGSPPVIRKCFRFLYSVGHHFQNAVTYGLSSLLGMGLRLPWKCSGALWGGDVGYWPYLSISLPHVVENCGEQ